MMAPVEKEIWERRMRVLFWNQSVRMRTREEERERRAGSLLLLDIIEPIDASIYI
jgi:hypothetical protein